MSRDGRLFFGIAAIAIAVLLTFLWRDRTTTSPVGTDRTSGPHAPETTGNDVSAATEKSADDHCTTSGQLASSRDVPDDIINRDTSGIREHLVQSQDPEHLAAAALFADSAADQVEDITKALAVGRGNAMLLWIAVQVCDDALDAVECPIEKWEEQLLRVDGQNRYAWARVAANRMRRGEPQAALDAMQRAASAAETIAYWPGTLEMLDRARAAAGDYQFSERSARGIAAANIPDYRAYEEMCREQSQVSAAWADACLRYGQQAELQDATALGRAAARAVQVASLRANGDDTVIREVVARQAQAGGEQSAASDTANITPQPASLKQSGEAVARDLLQAEMESLKLPSGPVECKRSNQGS